MEGGVRRTTPDGERGAPERAVVIGLLGGIASGKSQVAALLAERGARVIDADALAHRELERPAVRDAVVAAFGPDIADERGAIDRRALGRRVFGDPAALARLEAIVHPGVLAGIAVALETADAPAVVLDVPLLAEAGVATMCDALVFVDASRETRAARARARGWPEGELERREARQRGLAEKRATASAVIDNDGDLARTREQIEKFWNERIASRASKG